VCEFSKPCIGSEKFVGINECVGVVKSGLIVGMRTLAFGRGVWEGRAAALGKRATAQVLQIDNAYDILSKSSLVVI